MGDRTGLGVPSPPGRFGYIDQSTPPGASFRVSPLWKYTPISRRIADVPRVDSGFGGSMTLSGPPSSMVCMDPHQFRTSTGGASAIKPLKPL